MNQSLTQTAKILTLAVILSVGASYVYAWTAPTATPPGGNVSAPVNVGSASQLKTGGFDIANTLSAINGIFTGNVGIGTVSPTEKLDVAGNIKTGDDRNVSALMIGNWGHKIGREPSDGSLYIGGGQANIILQNNVGIGTASLAPWEKLKVNGPISISGADPDGLSTVTSEVSGLPLRLKSRAGNFPDFVVNTNGNVGIGTANPGVGLKLGVAGNVGADKYCNRDGNACITNTGTGIQFPDGTTQTTAYTGGGGGGTTISYPYLCRYQAGFAYANIYVGRYSSLPGGCTLAGNNTWTYYGQSSDRGGEPSACYCWKTTD